MLNLRGLMKIQLRKYREVLKHKFQSKKRRLKMEKIIKGINVLEQTPIKEYAIISNVFMGLGIGITIIATIIFFIKTKVEKF